MFQKLSWAAQLAAGATLFGISFWLEGEVLTAFLGHTWLAFALTGALEASKALTIVLYRIMKTQQLVSYPAAVRSLVLSFRVALVLLSGACSIMYLANMLDRPQLEAVRAEDLRHLEQEHMARMTHLREEHEAGRAETTRSIRERYRRLVQEAEERYLPAIRTLEESLSREMGNAVKGEFAGRRYRELERRLKEEKAAFEQRIGRLGEEEARESSRRLDDFTERYRRVTTKVEQDYQKRRQVLLANSYAGDARVENPIIHAFLSVLDAVLEFLGHETCCK